MTRVRDLPLDRLATTLAPLRGSRTDPASPLAALPLRVVAVGDGTAGGGEIEAAGWGKERQRLIALFFKKFLKEPVRKCIYGRYFIVPQRWRLDGQIPPIRLPVGPGAESVLSSPPTVVPEGQWAAGRKSR